MQNHGIILAAFGWPSGSVVSALGQGLIHSTWLVTLPDGQQFVLQQINDKVFRDPEALVENLLLIRHYLGTEHPAYVFPEPVLTVQGSFLLFLPDHGYYRAFRYLQGSHTVNVVEHPRQAYEAARKFGEFTRLLSNFPAERLTVVLPGFHDLSLRYRQFQDACLAGNPARIRRAGELIRYLRSLEELVTRFEAIKTSPDFHLRVTHHDTKISNVLFDAQDQGLCVIDLDTVMPGYFISDAGDMIRTYVCPVSEEEKDFSRIRLRPDIFEAIAAGYFSQMRPELSEAEKKSFVYAGQFMVYMQALRFLTDYLSDDIYYGRAYEDHNYVRAGNQAQLLKALTAAEPELVQVVNSFS